MLCRLLFEATRNLLKNRGHALADLSGTRIETVRKTVTFLDRFESEVRVHAMMEKTDHQLVVACGVQRNRIANDPGRNGYQKSQENGAKQS